MSVLDSMTMDQKREFLALYERRYQGRKKPVPRRRVRSRAYRAFQEKYWDDPVGFARDCIRWPAGEGLTDYQAEILQLMASEDKVAVRGPHGLGKTAMAAIVVLWFSLTRDGRNWKVVTTASAWQQLKRYLWPEIHLWLRRVRWGEVGRPRLKWKEELLDLSLKLDTGEAFAVASKHTDLIEGAHGDHLLYLFDEAKAIQEATFDAVSGAFSGAGDDNEREAKALAISTPGENQGRFYQIHTHAKGHETWKTRHVKLEEAIKAGRVTQEWADEMKEMWGEKSSEYQRRVLGEFAADDEAGVIPLGLIEEAQERLRALRKVGLLTPEFLGPLQALGMDPNGGGEDRATMAKRYLIRLDDFEFDEELPEILRNEKRDIWVIREVEDVTKPGKQPEMQLAGEIVQALRETGGRAVVDVIGVGSGLVSRLNELAGQGKLHKAARIVAFNAGAGTKKTDKSGKLQFLNCRAALWWIGMELLRESSDVAIAMPDDPVLTGELTAPKWRPTSSGKVQIESKDDVKGRLKRSTDFADAFLQSLWGGHYGEFVALSPGEKTEDAKKRQAGGAARRNRQNDSGVGGWGDDFDIEADGDEYW